MARLKVFLSYRRDDIHGVAQGIVERRGWCIAIGIALIAWVAVLIWPQGGSSRDRPDPSHRSDLTDLASEFAGIPVPQPGTNNEEPRANAATPTPSLTQAPVHAQPRTRNEGQVFKNPAPGRFTNTLGMEFVPVPGTKILMSVRETRVQDYAAYAAANSGVDDEWSDYEFNGHEQGPDHPVINVSWEDAQAFCRWLSKKEGKIYRLPTDREWSCAVGIGDRESATASPGELDMKVSGVYPWGTGWPPPAGAGNYHGEEGAFSGLSKISGYRDGHPFTAPCGSYTPNKLGIYDLGGNAYEWCEDLYPNSSSRVLRGASWDVYAPDYLLSSYRNRYLASYRFNFIGFRVVLGGVGER